MPDNRAMRYRNLQVRLYLFTCIRPVMIYEALVNVNSNWMSFNR